MPTSNASLLSAPAADLEGPAVPWFCWPQGKTVHIVSTNIHLGDAIGNFIVYYYRLFQQYGVPCRLYAEGYSAELAGQVEPIRQLAAAAAPSDVLLLNFSIYLPDLAEIAQIDCYKMVLFYGITPPQFLRAYQPQLADQCLWGYQQGPLLDGFDQFAAISVAAAQTLSQIVTRSLLPEAIHVIPPLVGLGQWQQIEAEPVSALAALTGRQLLYVGRVVPHKRIEDLLALFEAYARLDPQSQLVIVGSTDFQSYKTYLDSLIQQRYSPLQERIHFLGTVSDGQLKAIYHQASALVMMSEHEGFCVPLIEAMAFGLPVFAYAQAAVRETLGQTGQIFYQKEFEGVAQALWQVLRDRSRCQQLVARQQQQLHQMQRKADGSALWQLLETALQSEFDHESSV